MRTDIIIGGHQRCKVWSDLGNDTIPTVEIELDEASEMELNVRLNKNTGEFDFDMLANYFDVETLNDWGFEPYEFGRNYDEDISDLDNEDMADILADLTSGVRKAIQIDFNLEHYDEASRLVKEGRDRGMYVGMILIDILKKKLNDE